MSDLIQEDSFATDFCVDSDGLQTYQDPDVEKFIHENKGFITKDSAKDVIVQTRKLFETNLLEHKGPTFAPTVFVNHRNRERLVRDRDETRARIIDPRIPPELPFIVFPFAKDVCLNLSCFLAFTEFSGYIRHKIRAKAVYLKKEACGQLAFEELLTRKPLFYSCDRNVIIKSAYADPELKNWLPWPMRCRPKNRYIVEFCIIYPQGQVSTAMIICSDCGQWVESVLCPSTIESIKKDIMHNIPRIECAETEPTTRSVIDLPLRLCNVDGCSFVRGLMGFTPLMNKNSHVQSVFVRTRLTFICSPRNKFNLRIHHGCEDERQRFLPDIAETIRRLGIV